ncbi:ABC transporter permease subunit [Lentzea tibetensis]|uniref:ABC transporter permease subunit n=1 Tax=Lentzea tibetensis TaxID=2591470 RepID=A0A563EMC4_9PSEU|nr:ABC transporter permease subunit [Lentzea tibetensis]TWP48320.1 ABC transporter permease subunit [Lentzea tibetensis]
MIWVTYRQHRWLVAGTALAVALMALVRVLPRMPDYISYGAFGAIAAVFWGAPLLAREYEERTHVFAWSQDVSQGRWLAGKVLALGAALTLFAVVLWLAGLGTTTSRYPWDSFELGLFPLLGYAWFGFALGLAASALTRRTLVAMGLSLFVFTVTRVVLARWGREHYLPPVHTWRPDPPPGVDYVPQLPRDGLWIDSGYADRNGDPMPPPLQCNGDDTCLKANGQIGHFVDYQPGSRLVTFQLIEFAIFVVLAALLLFVAFRALRRGTRSRPTGSAAGTPVPAGSGSSTRSRATDPDAASVRPEEEPR